MYLYREQIRHQLDVGQVRATISKTEDKNEINFEKRFFRTSQDTTLNYRDWQISSHKSGSAHVTSSGKRTREAIPGNTKIQSGRSLRYPIRMQPNLAWVRSLLAKSRCTITFSRITNNMFAHFLPGFRWWVTFMLIRSPFRTSFSRRFFNNLTAAFLSLL